MLPRADQSKSALLRLPTELRLMILHKLLVTDGPLLDRGQYRLDVSKQARKDFECTCNIPDLMTEMRSGSCLMHGLVLGYALSPAILGTCQLLCTEGQPLLHGENTIGVRLSNTHPSTYSIFSTRTVAYIPALDMTNGYGCHYRDALDQHEVDLAMRFSSLRIEVTPIDNEMPSSQAVREVLRALTPGTAGTNIMVHVNLMNTCNTDSILRFLKAFKIMRCKKFQMIGVPDAFALQVENIIMIITGDTTIVDLEQRFYLLSQSTALRNFLRQPSPLGELVQFHQPGYGFYTQAMEVLQSAMEDCDEAIFRATLTKIGPVLRDHYERLHSDVNIAYEEACEILQ